VSRFVPAVQNACEQVDVLMLVWPHRLDVLVAHGIAHGEDLAGLLNPIGSKSMPTGVKEDRIRNTGLTAGLAETLLRGNDVTGNRAAR